MKIKFYYLLLCTGLLSVTTVNGQSDTLSGYFDWVKIGESNVEKVGDGVAWIDVNGDGYDDFVMSSSGMDVEILSQGIIEIYLSTGTSIPELPNQTLTYDADYETFGGSIDNAGDVNNDGYEDMLTTAANSDGGGKALLFLGSTTGFIELPVWEISVSEEYGSVPVSSIGEFDVNLDGYDDVIVSDLYAQVFDIDEGVARLYLGNATGLSTTYSWQYYGGDYSAYFGNNVSVGDINHDGWPDIIVGEEGVNYGTGRVEIYFGSASGFPLTSSLIKYESVDGEEFGSEVNIEGDLNNDGFNDLLIGVTNRINGNYKNAIDIHYGPITTEIGEPDTTLVYPMYNDGEFASNFAIKDITNDHFDDIIFTFQKGTSNTDYLGIYPVTSDGIAQYPQYISDDSLAFGDVDFGGDYNGDSLLDFAIGKGSLTDVFYLQGIGGYITGKPFLPGFPAYYPTFTTGTILDEEEFGYTLSATGDLNNDGIADLVVGNPYQSDPSSEEGKLFAYLGNNVYPNANYVWTYEMNQADALLGFDAKIIPDFNGDEFDDLFTGAPGYNYTSNNNGWIALFKGKSTGLYNYPAWAIAGKPQDANLGYSVSSGDINGDGKVDFVASAPNTDFNASAISKVYIYYGNGAVPDLSHDVLLKRDGKLGFGYKVDASGDINGDGFNDVLVTEDYLYNVHPAKVWLYYGGETMDTTADWSFVPPTATQDIGEMISQHGDFNQDGLNDIVIGNPSYTGGETLEGCVYIFYGKTTAPSSTPDLIIESNIANMKYGNSFTVGDMNGDGFDDLITGMFEYDVPNTNSGLNTIYYGKAAGISSDNKYNLTDFGGKTITYCPDADGDAIADLFVGAWSTAYAARGYVIMYKGVSNLCELTTDTSFTIISDTSITVSWTDVGATMYNIRIRQEGLLDWTLMSTPSTNATFESLLECTTYEIQINAECDGSSGDWQTVFVTTIGCPLPCYLVEIPDLTAGTITTSTAYITWGEPEEAIAYFLRYKKLTETSWIEFPIPVNAIILTTLSSCTDYEVQVKAQCIVDTSYWSDSFMFTTLCAGCASAPSGLFADEISTISAKTHWSVDPGAVNYKLYYKNAAGGPWIKLTVPVNFKTITGLSPSTTYQYKVKANCGAGIESPFSVIQSFTTLPMKLGEQQLVEMDVLPSPNNGDFKVLFSGFETAPDVNIYNLLGQLVYHTTCEQLDGVEISMGVAEPGIYLIELTNGVNNKSNIFVLKN